MAKSAAATVGQRARPRRTGSGRTGPKFPYDKMLTDLGKRDSRSQRAAYYLNWAATTRPYHYLPFNVIVTDVMNYQALRKLTSDDVHSLRRNMGQVRKLLQTVYGRDLDIAGAGARATVDDTDATTVALPKKMRRLRSAKNSVMATYRLIDHAQVKDPKAKNYLAKSVRDVVRLIGSEDFDRKLLPPGEE